MNRRVVRKRDLPADPPVGVMLWCAWCVESFSACSRDYFLLGSDARIDCPECGQPIRLVQKKITYTDWRQPCNQQIAKATK